MIMWRKRVARLAILVLLGAPVAACEELVTVWGSVGVTVNKFGGLVFVAVWCEGAPDVLHVAETDYDEGDLNALYQTEGLPKASSTTLDTTSPAPWHLTDGVPSFADDVSYSAGMGELGKRSDDVEVDFRPEDVRRRVPPGQVMFASLTSDGNEIRPIAEFKFDVRAACEAPPASSGGAPSPAKPG